MRTLIYWSAFGISVITNVLYILALFITPTDRQLKSWVRLVFYGTQAGCFAVYFLTTDSWQSKALDLVYVASMLWLYLSERDRRKKKKKPSRAAGRVVDLGHRLAVVPTRG
jgi:hypothetical protein